MTLAVTFGNGAKPNSQDLEVRNTAGGKSDQVIQLSSGNSKVIRGGSWSYLDRITVTGTLHAMLPLFEVDALGFRLVRNPD